MTEKPQASPALGLELTPSALLAAELSLKNGAPHLDQLIEIETTKVHDDVKPLYKEGEESKLLKLVNQTLSVTALPTSHVLVRPLEVKLPKIGDVDTVLDFQAEPLLPYTAEDGVIDRIHLYSTDTSSFLTIQAARNDHLFSEIGKWSDLTIEPEMISSVPSAIAAFSSALVATENPHFIVHIGEKEITCALVHLDKLYAAQSVSNSDDLDRLMIQVQKVLYAFLSKYKQNDVKEILFTGDESLAKKLSPVLRKELDLKRITPKQSDAFQASLIELQRYAVPIGAALTALPGHPQPINFRQKEFTYPHPWKRIKGPIFTYLGTCVLLTFAAYVLGNFYIGSQEAEIRQSYVSLLSDIQKPYEEIERKVQGSKGRSIPPEQLSRYGIQKRLSALEKEIESAPQSFPLQPNTPRVSDLLGWLSSHPHVAGKEGSKDHLELESLSYKMVKRPDSSKKREKYQIKVDLEFKAPNPTYAREFYDILLSPNDFVDPKQEVKWGTSRGKYQTSFFLKDKTIYP